MPADLTHDFKGRALCDFSGSIIRTVTFAAKIGWLHLPVGPSRRAAGLILCSPPGRDGRSVSKAMRVLAMRLAEQGFPVLRFDPLGIGDSLDLPKDQDAWPLWLTDLDDAKQLLIRETGISKLVLGGVRLGASLAASSRLGADGLLLMAPIVSGRQWLRELKLAGAFSGTLVGPESDDLESDGLHLNLATATGLKRLDLRTSNPAPNRVLLFAQNPAVATLSEPMMQEGSAVVCHDFTDYDLLFEDTHSNQPPHLVFEQILIWMDQSYPDTVAMIGPRGDPDEQPAALALPHGLEREVQFGQGLSGVICNPQNVDNRAQAVIFLNTSGEPRAGIGRFAVIAARALAERGIASLRFDFAGIGESEGERGHVYETSRRADIGAALSLLTGLGFSNVTLVGICSGSFHAIHQLTADPRVSAAFLVSPKFIWRPTESLTPEMGDRGRATGAYMAGLKDPATWQRLARGGIDVAAVFKTFVQRVGERLQARLRDHGARALRSGMAAASERGGRARFLLGLDDAALDHLETIFGARGARLSALSGMSIRVEPILDHGLARAQSRAIVVADLLAFVDPT